MGKRGMEQGERGESSEGRGERGKDSVYRINFQ